MEPYVKEHGIKDLKFKFFTEEAIAWYDPLKPYTLLEYQWVVDSLNMKGQVVVDAGAHHGNYAVVFKGAYMIYAFEMNGEFAYYAHENMSLNQVGNFMVYPERLTEENVVGKYLGQLPDIYKMDIEGDEFHVLPVELKENPQVHTWIIEMHPWIGNPNDLAGLFMGYNLLKVDREQMKVRPYKIGEKWPTHATLIARRES